VNEQLWWFVARASGIVALVILSLAIVWGLLYSTRLLGGKPTPKWLLDLHRFLGGLAVVFTVVHLGALVADDFVHFGVSEILLPFASEWQPGAVAWGVVAIYLLVTVEVTSLAMRRLPRRLWRAIHTTSWVLFWLAVVHGATAGTDSGNVAYIAVSLTAVTLVLFLTIVRMLTSRRVRGAIPTARTVEPRLKVGATAP
jgi:DMSO/TMAO reductase YedYZ heme-binding membrane subunit